MQLSGMFRGSPQLGGEGVLWWNFKLLGACLGFDHWNLEGCNAR
jgi:hypothetical protein